MGFFSSISSRGVHLWVSNLGAGRVSGRPGSKNTIWKFAEHRDMQDFMALMIIWAKNPGICCTCQFLMQRKRTHVTERLSKSTVRLRCVVAGGNRISPPSGVLQVVK